MRQNRMLGDTPWNRPALQDLAVPNCPVGVPDVKRARLGDVADVLVEPEERQLRDDFRIPRREGWAAVLRGDGDPQRGLRRLVEERDYRAVEPTLDATLAGRLHCDERADGPLRR